VGNPVKRVREKREGGAREREGERE